MGPEGVRFRIEGGPWRAPLEFFTGSLSTSISLGEEERGADALGGSTIGEGGGAPGTDEFGSVDPGPAGAFEERDTLPELLEPLLKNTGGAPAVGSGIDTERLGPAGSLRTQSLGLQSDYGTDTSGQVPSFDELTKQQLDLWTSGQQISAPTISLSGGPSRRPLSLWSESLLSLGQPSFWLCR